MKPRSLTIAFFNAHGLKKQKDEIALFLTEHQIDILLVQETLLKPSIRSVRIANYNVVRNDRPTQGGGTLIYYKRSLHCVPLDPPSLSNSEVAVCRIGMSGHESIIVASLYLPPTKTPLRSDFEALFAMGNSVIIGGDFNSKNTQWNCLATSRNGRLLAKLAEELPFDVIAPMSPTHYPDNVNHRPDILDMAILKNVGLRLHSIEVHHALDSDHRPVILQLGSPTSLPTTKTILDWDRLGKNLELRPNSVLDSVPDRIVSPNETNHAIDALTSHISAAISESSRQIPAMANHRWRLPDDMRQLLRAKNAATRAYDSYPTEDNRVRLRALQRSVKERMSELRNNQWDSLLEEISPSHQAYWKLARSFKSDSVSTMPPLSRPDDSIAFDDGEKAECLADSLEAQCSPSNLPVDPIHLSTVDSEVERLSALAPTSPLAPTTVDEVQTIIKGFRPNKAPGPDRISNRVLRALPAQLICLLVAIFNGAMANCIFPAAWKEADVIGIPKPGKDRSKPASYRPISLLKTMGKIYERVLVSRLRDYIFSNNLLIDEQFGFRASHSCVEQVHRLTEHILDGLNRPKPMSTGALFFDVAKAFDKVWHNGLIYKLYQLKVPDSLVHILRDFLSNRTFRYRVEGTYSSPRPIRAGVPQGSVLSPLLFSLFINDIPRTPQIELALFADDTALYHSGYHAGYVIRALQRAAKALGDWFARWRIEVNPEKSAAVYFTRGHFNSKTPKRRLIPITLYDRPIPWEKTVKYLGVTLDRRMSFAPHVKRVRQTAAFYSSRLYHLVGRKSKMSLRNKLTIYKACIRPVMTYASPVFAHAAPSILRKLQTLQNKFLRAAADAPWYVRNVNLHRDLRIPTIAEFMKETSKRFFDKAVNHRNPLVVKAATYSSQKDVAIRFRRPRNVLDDPDDEITAYNKRVALTNQHYSTQQPSTSSNQRTRRRVRGPVFHFGRYRHVPGRFSPVRPSDDGPSRGPSLQRRP